VLLVDKRSSAYLRYCVNRVLNLLLSATVLRYIGLAITLQRVKRNVVSEERRFL